MTPDDLARLKALAEAATPGKRLALVRTGRNPPRLSPEWQIIAATAHGHGIYSDHPGGCSPSADMEFIAACDPTTILALIAAASPVPAGEFGERLRLIERAREIIAPFVETDGEGDVDSEGLLNAVADALVPAKHYLRPMGAAPRDGSWIFAVLNESDTALPRPLRWDAGYSIHGLGGSWTGDGGTYGDMHLHGWLDGEWVGDIIEDRKKIIAERDQLREATGNHVRAREKAEHLVVVAKEANALLLAERDAARAALSTMQKAAHEAFTHLDADRDAKALKMLHAMAGGLPGYRADIDAALTALEPTP